MKIKDEKRLVEITLRVWSNGQYSQDLSVGLLDDGSFEYEQGACKVDNVDDVIDYAFLTGKIAQVILLRMKTQTTTAALMLI